MMHVAADPAFPDIGPALNLTKAQIFLRRLPGLAGATLNAVQVTRHKPGRRCVIEYDLLTAAGAPLTLIGKARRKRFGNADCRLHDALWQAGFDAHSVDGIGVPEALGTLGKTGVWLQRKATGVVAGALFEQPDAPALAARIADAAYKLHHTGIETTRTHGMADELRILKERLGALGERQPVLRMRLNALLSAATALGDALPAAPVCPIHRDFYSDQVIVDEHGAHLTLIDFDLFCHGDPAVDIGNFAAHITEQSLRLHGDPGRLRPLENALIARYIKRHTAEARPQLTRAIAIYAWLTLLRLIDISDALPERRRLTRPLLELCETRVPERAARRQTHRPRAGWFSL
jgi:hypothetical protein